MKLIFLDCLLDVFLNDFVG